MSSKTLTLQIDPRESLGTGNSRRLRRAEQIPAVVYGHGGPGFPILVKGADLATVMHHSGLISLEIAGNGTKSAILKDIQRHPIGDYVLHIDFQEVKADEVISSHAIIEPVGTPAGSVHGGQLEQVVHEVEIRCLPADMVETIEVDVSGLEVDDTLLVSDLVLPEGIELTLDPESMICQVRIPRVVEEDEEVAEGEEGEEGAEEGEEGEGAETEDTENEE